MAKPKKNEGMTRPENPNDEGTKAHEAFECLANAYLLCQEARALPAQSDDLSVKRKDNAKRAKQGAERRKKLHSALKQCQRLVVKEEYPGVSPEAQTAISAALAEASDERTDAAVAACAEMF